MPLNWRLAAPEIAFLLEDCDPALLIHEDAFTSLLPAAGSCPRWSSVKRATSSPMAMAACPAEGAGEGRRLDPDAPITILYSSGTTGKPKGAVVSLHNGFTGALGLALATNAEHAGTLLLDMPLFHTAGLFGSGWSMMIMGGTVLISQKLRCARHLRATDRPATGRHALFLGDADGNEHAPAARISTAASWRA